MWSGKKIDDGRAEVKQKMRDGRANNCAMVEQKLNKKCEMVFLFGAGFSAFFHMPLAA
jgi:hypothetical protein